jgi:hypothetical protein
MRITGKLKNKTFGPKKLFLCGRRTPMPRKDSTDPMTPELVRLFKLFGAASLLLVLILSFFNERRADNRGDHGDSSISDASRIYFKNVRRAYYDLEIRSDAKMELYRLGNRVKDSTALALNSVLIINKVKDAAYLYLEPQGLLKEVNPLPIRWINAMGDTTEVSIIQGDRESHFHFVEKIFPHLVDKVKIEAHTGSDWVQILEREEELESFRITIADFFRLLGR